MTPSRPPAAASGPRYGAAWAALAYAAATMVFAFPALTGGFLVSPTSDQYIGGYAVRNFGHEVLVRTGHFAQWNPYLFGGMPYIGIDERRHFLPAERAVPLSHATGRGGDVAVHRPPVPRRVAGVPLPAQCWSPVPGGADRRTGVSHVRADRVLRLAGPRRAAVRERDPPARPDAAACAASGMAADGRGRRSRCPWASPC